MFICVRSVMIMRNRGFILTIIFISGIYGCLQHTNFHGNEASDAPPQLFDMSIL